MRPYLVFALGSGAREVKLPRDLGSCVQETPLKALRKEDKDHHTCLWLAADSLPPTSLIFFLCVMRGDAMTPKVPPCRHVTSQGRRCWLYPGNPSEAPGPLVQLSSPGGSTSEGQKASRFPHPPHCLGRKPCLWPQTHFPKQTCSGRLRQREGGREQEAV